MPRYLSNEKDQVDLDPSTHFKGSSEFHLGPDIYYSVGSITVPDSVYP